MAIATLLTTVVSRLIGEFTFTTHAIRVIFLSLYLLIYALGTSVKVKGITCALAWELWQPSTFANLGLVKSLFPGLRSHFAHGLCGERFRRLVRGRSAQARRQHREVLHLGHRALVDDHRVKSRGLYALTLALPTAWTMIMTRPPRSPCPWIATTLQPQLPILDKRYPRPRVFAGFIGSVAVAAPPSCARCQASKARS